MRLDPDKLKRLRVERAMSQEGLAARSGLSRKTVQRMEQGADVRSETLSFVAAALGVAITDFSAPTYAERAVDRDTLALKRIRSGKHVLHQLSLTDVGRVECDVDATAETIELLIGLVTRLQELMRSGWDKPRPRTAEMPLLERLNTVASLNDALGALEGHGIGLFMGHYYRFPVGPSPGARPELEQSPIVMTRIFITCSPRDRMQVTIDADWIGAPEGFLETDDPSDLFTPAGEARVFLHATPPLRRVDAAQQDSLEGQYNIL